MTDPNRADRTEGPPLDGRFVPPTPGPPKPPSLTFLIVAEVAVLVVFAIATHSFSGKEKWTAAVFWAIVIGIAITVWLNIRLHNRQRG